MSTLECPVIPVVLEKHPNADSLSIVKVFGWQVIVKTENFQTVNLAAYIPVNSLLSNEPEFEGFVQKRVKAIRLRGIYSEGILIPARPHWKLNDNVVQELGVTKYEPPEPILMQTEDTSAPDGFHCYTEIENFRRYPDKFIVGEEVVITEKIHGANARFLYVNTQKSPMIPVTENETVLKRLLLQACDSLSAEGIIVILAPVFKNNELSIWYANNSDFQFGQFYVGSHRNCKKANERNLWWKAAFQYDLEDKLRHIPNHLVFGEVFGNVQDLKYNAKPNELFLAIFDVFAGNRYLDYDEFVSFAKNIEVPIAPLIYRGPWNPDLISLTEGSSLWPGANNIREGIVIRPVKERYDPEIKRVILKVVSQQYLLRKGGSEKH